MTPGRLLGALLDAAAPDQAIRDAMLGDLAEEAAAIELRAGRPAARRWYRRQVLASLPPLIRLSIRRLPARSWGGAGLAALGGYLAVMILILVGASGLRAAGGPELAGPAASSQAAAVAVSVLGAVAGGYLAAWIGRHAPYASAAALGVLVLVIGLVRLRYELERIPLGAYLGLELTAIPRTLCGAALRRRHAARQEEESGAAPMQAWCSRRKAER